MQFLEKTIIMRVLHLIKNFDFGGAENHVRELVNSLDGHGHTVYVVGGRGRQESRLNEGVKFFSMRISDVMMPLQIITICYILLRNKVQIIHAHQRLPILIACIAGMITGIPVVATVHGRTRFDLRSWISRKFSAKIIFVSRQVLEVSAKYEEIKHKSVIIPNWVETSQSQSEKVPYSISYISRLDKKHSAVILLMIHKVIGHLAIKFPEITFKIIGGGDFVNEIKEEARSLNIRLKREACLVCGFVPDVKEIIQSSELVMGVGRVALEAMACGVPVLSVNQKRMGTIITTDNYLSYRFNNFVAVANPAPDGKTLIDLIGRFFDNPGVWQNEASVLKGYVDEDFDPYKISDSISVLYAETVKSRRNILVPVVERIKI
jgi:glycosyltransferase involved in cell wall biosynthesis